jgi:hypothetical protein
MHAGPTLLRLQRLGAFSSSPTGMWSAVAAPPSCVSPSSSSAGRCFCLSSSCSSACQRPSTDGVGRARPRRFPLSVLLLLRARRPGSSSSVDRAHLHRSPSPVFLLRRSSLSPPVLLLLRAPAAGLLLLGRVSSSLPLLSLTLATHRIIGAPPQIWEGERIHEFPCSPSHPDRCAHRIRALLQALQCSDSAHSAHVGRDMAPAGDSLRRVC